MFSRLIVAVTTLVAFATAQSSGSASATPTTTQMPATATAGFDRGQVNITIARSWCLAQQNTCPQICGGSTRVNFCDATTLTYQCVCSNGTAPDVTAYTNTIPFFICQQTYIQCVAAHPNDLQAQTNCADARQCGNMTAAAVTATTSASSSSSASSSASGSATGSASSSASAAATSKAAASSNTQNMANGAFVILLAAAMKLVL